MFGNIAFVIMEYVFYTILDMQTNLGYYCHNYLNITHKTPFIASKSLNFIMACI